MKRFVTIIFMLSLFIPLFGCNKEDQAQIIATTLPVYEFTASMCKNTGLQVKQLISEEVSCLHDYTLKVDQTKALESAQLVVISGAGLEAFLPDIEKKKIVDASTGIELHCADSTDAHTHDESHNHSKDPHIWLSVANAKDMCKNIFNGLVAKYPEHSANIAENYSALETRLTELEHYAMIQLSQTTHSELITFHDGFHYLAEGFNLKILRAIEEESGSEASAHELKELITVVREHQLPAIFTERSGSTSSADIISRETGVPVYTLDMAMSGNSYFDAMYHNIDILKEALE